MNDKLLIGVPSKGRLQENTQSLFARAGFSLERARGGRDYRGTLGGLEGVEVLFLSASEIAEELGRGGLHLGVTGEDLLRETWGDCDERMGLLSSLGFGSADVVVAVPDVWIDVFTISDLEDVAARFRAKHGRKIRVATKYVQLTRAFFNAHHFVDYRIVESAGATEAAPAAGTAELIVDITTTGTTLAANGLRVLDDGVILKSSAHLVMSKRGNWGKSQRASASMLLRRLSAVQRAEQSVEVVFSKTFDAKMQDLLRKNGAEPHENRVYLRKGEAYRLIEDLMALGANDLVVNTRVVDMIFEQNPALLKTFESALKSI